MIYILHIETSTKVCSVALSLNGQLVQYQTIVADGFVHSEKLNGLIEQVVNDAEIEFKQLNAISVSGGPGSYTGLRIGVSTAKGLCYALNIPLIAIDSIECIVRWAKSNFPNYSGLYCGMIDARRMEVFSAIYSANLTLVKPLSADELDENSYSKYTESNQILLCGDGALKLNELWANRTQFVFSEILSDARGQVEQAFYLYKTAQFVDTAYYEPYYLKDFIAGTKKG